MGFKLWGAEASNRSKCLGGPNTTCVASTELGVNQGLLPEPVGNKPSSLFMLVDAASRLAFVMASPS
eukprot:5139678-Amphidinium_carterae.1